MTSYITPNLLEISQCVKPLSNRVLVKRIQYEHPTLYVAGITLSKGLVVAVGPGKRQRRKVRFNLCENQLSTQRALYFEDGEETGRTYPMPFKVGDFIEFSPRNLIEWEFMGEKLLWVRADGCYGTSTDSQSEALLWQESAGYDREGHFLSGRE